MKRYLADGTYISEKGFYENGQVSYSGLTSMAHIGKEYKRYSPDGKLTERMYKKA